MAIDIIDLHLNAAILIHTVMLSLFQKCFNEMKWRSMPRFVDFSIGHKSIPLVN